MWGTVLSDPLPIVGLVGRRPANNLMGRMPVPDRVAAFVHQGCPQWTAWRITRRFHRLCARRGWVAYALRTRPPLSPPRRGVPVRLACIRPAASVHPEPGSNSPLYIALFSFVCPGPVLRSSQIISGMFAAHLHPFKELTLLRRGSAPPFRECKSTTFSNTEHTLRKKKFSSRTNG